MDETHKSVMSKNVFFMYDVASYYHVGSSGLKSEICANLAQYHH